MTWEETIKYIQQFPEYQDLIRDAYLNTDILINAERYYASDEFQELMKLINYYSPHGKIIADIGAGNGICSYSFAREGFNVYSIEPDKSSMVGAGAIEKLKNSYGLNNIVVFQEFGESLSIPAQSVDIVFFRQAIHHFLDIDRCLSEAARILKRHGLLIAIREHIIYNHLDKDWFLMTHPLQKFYGGENAFTLDEYCNALKISGLKIQKIFRFYDHSINYFPIKKENVNIERLLKKKIGILGRLSILKKIYKIYLSKKGKLLDERNIPGRMYSFIAIKS